MTRVRRLGAWMSRSLGRDLAEGGVDRDSLALSVFTRYDEDHERNGELQAGRDQLLRAVEEEQVVGQHEVHTDGEVEQAEHAADRHDRDPGETPVDRA